MVFIKPIILRNAKDSYQATSEKYNNTRRYELEWIRSQEEYEKTDSETVMPPLQTQDLPLPFSNPPLILEANK
jgi:general secretion pathway protein D